MPGLFVQKFVLKQNWQFFVSWQVAKKTRRSSSEHPKEGCCLAFCVKSPGGALLLYIFGCGGFYPELPYRRAACPAGRVGAEVLQHHPGRVAAVVRGHCGAHPAEAACRPLRGVSPAQAPCHSCPPPCGFLVPWNPFYCFPSFFFSRSMFACYIILCIHESPHISCCELKCFMPT